MLRISEVIFEDQRNHEPRSGLVPAHHLSGRFGVEGQTRRCIENDRGNLETGPAADRGVKPLAAALARDAVRVILNGEVTFSMD